MRSGPAAPTSIVFFFFFFSPLLPAPAPPSQFLADHAGRSRQLPMKSMAIPPAAAHGRRPHHGRISPFLLVLVFLVVTLSRPAAAQAPASGSQNAYGTFRGGFGPALGVVVVLLVSALFFMVFFAVYLRQCGEHADNSSGTGGAAGRNLHGARSRRAASRGLDPAVVQAFPTLVYAEVKEHKIGKGALECAVCLCEFDDEETLRLLPKCDHVFHTDCIDAWLSSHTTCPVCRSNLAAPEGPKPTADDAAAPPPDETGVSSGNEGAREPAGQQQGDVVIVVDEARAGEPSLGRTESKNRRRWLWSRSLPALPRSHSTGHSLARRGEDRERFTLRLPAHIRRDVMAGKFQRSSSFAAVEGGGRRTRRSHREAGEGSGRSIGGAIGGRSYKMRRWEGSAKSDRWAFFSRTLSMVVSRGENDAAEGPSQGAEGGGGGGREARREGSTNKG